MIPDIYIAGKFEAQARLRRMRDEIHAAGTGRVIGTWLDEEPSYGKPSSAEALEYAQRDQLEVAEADLLILDTFDENNRGGREVEFGMALMALYLGAPGQAWVVGPKRNVFHELAPHFESWGDVMDELKKGVEI